MCRSDNSLKLNTLHHTMKITNIQHSLRGLTADISIGTATIITGLNKSGKTTLLDAITSACVGYIPRLGKTNAKMEPLIGPSGAASSRISFDNNTFRGFDIRRNPDGSISSSKVPKEPLGPILFDGRLFMDAKPQDRVAMIQDAVGSKEDIIAELAACLKGQRSLASKSKDLGEWLTETHKNIASQLKDNKQHAARQEKALQAIVEHTDEDGSKFRPSDLAEARADRDTIVRELAKQAWALEVDNQKLEQVRALLNQSLPPPPKASVDDLRAMMEALNTKRDAILTKMEGEKGTRAALDKVVSGRCPLNDSQLLAWSSDSIAKASQAEDSSDHGSSWNIYTERAAVAAANTLGDALRAAWVFLHAPRNDDTAEAMRKVLDGSTCDRDLEAVEYSIESISQSLEAWDAHRERAAAVEDGDRLEAWCSSMVNIAKVLSDSQLLADSKIAALEAQAQKFAEAQAIVKHKQDVESALSEAKANIAELEQAAASLKAETQKRATMLMEPICAAANRYLQGILPHPLTSVNFTLGFHTGSQWVDMSSFSGSETAAATMAIQCALSAKSDFKIAILDEAQRLDAESIEALQINIRDSIQDGDLDQAIIVGSRLHDVLTHGWNSIILE